MKKLITIATAITMLLSTSSFVAGEENADLNASVKASFNKEFSTATEISWQKKNEVLFASFTINNSQAEAAYNENGELLALSRQISYTQLPLSISVAIAEKYEGYKVATNATEITYEGQTNYYINVSDGKEILRLRSPVNGSINIDSKKKL
jgi:hypothetical protein